jgi:poly(A) polymerase
MLKRIVNFFDTKTLTSKPLVVDANTYGINPASMSKDAIKVVRTLQKAGYEAYIVGGSVRDLLLGIHPKDFDVATDAQPAEVKSLFRRSRIIGRRFQIVHVQLSRELIEVTTFRSNEQSNGTTV